MNTYVARMMDAETGSEGRYEFEADDGLLGKSPVKVVRAFMEHVDKDLFPHQHIDYELNAAFKNKGKKVVTAMGSLVTGHDPEIPFLLMIVSKKREQAALADA